ncbi:hypothetical protein D5086_014741 [Populus alba]|uniref:Uncharacterized protein n=1 Tax=Populus alba TaxID=43335 RepID=A0ACC4BZ62_POPAL
MGDSNDQNNDFVLIHGSASGAWAWYKDLSLQTLLKRSGSLFLESLAKANKFTKEKFGSVVRDYVVCTQDLLVVPSLQRFMIEHNEVKEVMEIPADHMAIASRPKELCQCLLEFARKHA